MVHREHILKGGCVIVKAGIGRKPVESGPDQPRHIHETEGSGDEMIQRDLFRRVEGGPGKAASRHHLARQPERGKARLIGGLEAQPIGVPLVAIARR